MKFLILLVLPSLVYAQDFKRCGGPTGQRVLKNNEIAIKFSYCKDEYIITQSTVASRTGSTSEEKAQETAQLIYDETGVMLDVELDRFSNIVNIKSDETTQDRINTSAEQLPK